MKKIIVTLTFLSLMIATKSWAADLSQFNMNHSLLGLNNLETGKAQMLLFSFQRNHAPTTEEACAQLGSIYGMELSLEGLISDYAQNRRDQSMDLSKLVLDRLVAAFGYCSPSAVSLVMGVNSLAFPKGVAQGDSSEFTIELGKLVELLQQRETVLFN